MPAAPGNAMIRHIVFCLGLCAASASAAPSETCPAPPAPFVATTVDTVALDAYIQQGLRDWKLPGVSVAVVKDGRPVYVKGFGTRSLQDGGAVDGDTLFGMMSTTKAMTALALAMLVDEGKLGWDDPVTTHLPGFALSDPYVTRDLRVRDLLTHNSGLGNTDLLWARGDFDAREIIARLRGLPLSYPLRGGFAYQNVMYQVAGEVIGTASGMSWADFVDTRILKPLAMTRSYPTLARMQAARDGNVSAAHFEIDGKLQVIAESPVDAVPAAGAAWSSAADTAKWLTFMLGDGCMGGTRLVSTANFRELLKPQAMVPAGEFYPTAKLTRPHWTSYGLGWFQQDYLGRFVAMHTGSMDGRTAIIGLMPEENLGVYVFGNLDHAEFRHALMWKLFDAYTGAPARDWSKELLALYGGMHADAKAAQAKQDAARVRGTKPSHALAAYAGTYRHPVYGDVTITRTGNVLHLAMGPLPDNAGILQHWHYDSFRVKLGDGRYGWNPVIFRVGADGGIAALRLFDDSSDALEFTRVAKP
ncbi:serine hydrolase [Arenimonas maotaiensis]|uniref:Serine hydrolase n=2 Tax=Arenimonas maotaiensis TaxID=1446479 RepID=A0A917CP30_9GAMM|nr:serine hydrolase [Arenimonas maotaiensis]